LKFTRDLTEFEKDYGLFAVPSGFFKDVIKDIIRQRCSFLEMGVSADNLTIYLDENHHMLDLFVDDVRILTGKPKSTPIIDLMLFGMPICVCHTVNDDNDWYSVDVTDEHRPNE